jgi:hypothetical protein
MAVNVEIFVITVNEPNRKINEKRWEIGGKYGKLMMMGWWRRLPGLLKLTHVDC